MVNTIKVYAHKGDLQRTSNVLKRIRRRIPVMTSSAMMEWGKTLERDMKTSARQANIKPFTGTLYKKGIRWEQRPKGRIGRLLIRQYGIMLDEMKPHWVNITQRRTRLLKWGMRQSNDLIRNASVLIASGKLRKKSIYVRPHPFIMNGWGRARPKLLPIIKKHINMGMKT